MAGRFNSQPNENEFAVTDNSNEKTMKTLTPKPKLVMSANKNANVRLFFLEASGGRVHSVNTDGSDRKVMSTGVGCRMASWSMLKPATSTGPTWAFPAERRLDRARRPRRAESQDDRSRRRHVHAETAPARKASGKLYWCDREGMRVMRANLDGSKVETLVETGQGDARPARSRRNGASESPSIRSADKSTGRKKARTTAGKGRIFRANIEIPKGESAGESHRHRSAVRRPAGADRSRARSGESRPVLDRPRRSAARQHREPRTDGCGSRNGRRRKFCSPT